MHYSSCFCAFSIRPTSSTARRLSSTRSARETIFNNANADIDAKINSLYARQGSSSHEPLVLVGQDAKLRERRSAQFIEGTRRSHSDHDYDEYDDPESDLSASGRSLRFDLKNNQGSSVISRSSSTNHLIKGSKRSGAHVAHTYSYEMRSRNNPQAYQNDAYDSDSYV